jgi:phosphate-selective porin
MPAHPIARAHSIARLLVGFTLVLTPVVASAQPLKLYEVSPVPPGEPLAGWSDGTLFLRSADNQFQLFPNGRLQVDGYFFKRDDAGKMPTDTFLLRRARVEMYGWIGPWFGFNIAGDFALGAPAAADPVAQSWLATTDDYMVIAPFENLAILQAGQFDAPFTLENRTSDKYFDFMERSITVRAFGIPTNKEVGLMLHGILPDSIAYYSVAVLNGDGQNFRNADNNFDAMGRAWVAPFKLAHAVPELENVTIGGSLWAGQRGGNGLPFANLSTQGGLAFTTNKGTFGMAKTPTELHQHHDLRAWALEADVPIAHKYGVRIEFVHKSQDLDIDDVTTPTKLVELGTAELDGFSIYGELWWWAVGDDTIIGAPGLQLPPRIKTFGTKPPRHGLMLLTRLERLDMDITATGDNPDSFGIGSVGVKGASGTKTQITSWELGVNYWYSKRFRATFNYVLNLLDGDTAQIKATKAINGGNDDEHEFLFRMAVAL